MSPRLLDLGISQVHGEKDPEEDKDLLLGTPYFMSPEQTRSREGLDCRSDIYSLGCTMFFVLTGKVPYEAETVQQVLTKHSLDPIPSPKAIVSDLSDEIVLLLQVMMAKKPEDRQQSWDEVLTDLKQVLNGSAPAKAPKTQKKAASNKRLRARSAGAVPQTAAATTSSRGTFILFGGIALAAVVMFVGGFFVYTRFVADKEGRATRRELQRQAEDEKRQRERDKRARNKRRQIAEERRRREAERKRREQARRDQSGALKQEFEAIQAFERQNPQAYTATIKRYGDLVVKAATRNNSTCETKARQAYMRLREARDKKMQEVMQDLADRAQRADDEQGLAAAAAVYRDYNGVLAAETKQARLARADAFDARLEAAARMAVKAQGYITRLAGQLARRMLALDYAAAAEFLAQAQPAEGIADLPDFRKLKEFVRQTKGFQKHILASFEKQQGKMITVRTRKGPRELRIESVDGHAINTVKETAVGDATMRMKRTLSIQELHAREMFDRVGTGESDVHALWRAVLLLRAGRRKTAAEELERVPEPLRQSLLFLTLKRGPEYEAQAAAECRRILQQAGLNEPASDSPATIRKAAAIEQRGLEAQKLVNQVEVFLRHFGDSQSATQRRHTLRVLLATASGAVHEQPSDEAVDKILADATVACGPNADIQVEKLRAGCRLTIGGNPRWDDLKALDGNPVQSLNVGGAGTFGDAQLAAVTALDLPLVRLDLPRTGVSWLDPLQAARHLMRLDLTATAVRDLSPLRGLPLVELNLSQTDRKSVV